MWGGESLHVFRQTDVQKSKDNKIPAICYAHRKKIIWTRLPMIRNIVPLVI